MKFKNLAVILVIISLFVSSTGIAFANSEQELLSSYSEIMNYAKGINVDLGMTYDDFKSGYDPQQYSSVESYTKSYYEALQPQNSVGIRSGGGSPWYYNTGTSLPQKANYSKYNLLNIVQPGDIIYESKGGLGVTGHTAIVEGIFWDSTQQQYYIRVIEAIGVGVCRSVIDDQRVDDKGISVYRVKNASSSAKNNSINFCIGELGSSYNLDFAKDTSSAETDWYCSELNWAGYKNQGIDIEVSWNGEPGVTPRDITVYSSKVYKIF